MSLGSEVNMTNCVKHWHHFFNRYRFINDPSMLAYWMMAGYLGPASEFREAFSKGWNIRRLEPARGCKHEGFCILDNLGFFDLLDFDFSSRYVDFDKYDDHANIKIVEWKRMTYLVDYEATPESLKKMLAYDGHPNNAAEAKNLNALLIRGCEFLSSTGDGIFPDSTNFNSLTVVEISSSPCSPIDIGIISELTRLEGLNLSHLPDLEMLPDNFFYKLRHLRWLIVRGCSKLRSLPSIDGLTRLVVLDFSHCTGLQLPFFLVDIRYPHLQMLDLSYTPMIYMLRELSTPNLTHLFLRGSRSLKNLVILNKLDNLQVLDLSGCENLRNLSPFMNVPSLKHLNLSGCTSFTNFHEGLFDQMSCHEDLDLSWTKVMHLPSSICLTSLRKLSLRGLELDSLETLASLPSQLLQLDLKVSSSQSQELEFLQSLEKLEILNLSGSSVEKLPDLCKLVSLKKLLLANCPQLKVVPNFTESVEILNLSKSSVEKLPDMSKFGSLEKLLLADCKQLKVVPDLNANRCLKELDLSGLQICSMEDFNLDFLQSLCYLEILNLSRSSMEKLPNIISGSLQNLLLADCPKLKVVPDLSFLHCLKTLDLSLPDDSSIESRQLEFVTQDRCGRGSFPLPKSLQRLVLKNRSGLQKLFPTKELVNLEFLDLRGTDVADCDSILGAPKAKAAEIHVFFGTKSHQPSEVDDFVDVAIKSDALIYLQKKLNSAMTTIHTVDQAVKMQLEMLDRDLMYIQKNIEGLKNTHRWKSGEELLQELVDAAADLSTQAHLAVDSDAFKQLRRVVLKLKLLVTPKDKNDSKALQITQKKKAKSSLFINNKESIGITDVGKDMQGIMTDLLTSYRYLSQVQKQCLLCFSIFPLGEDDKKNTLCGIKKSFLIMSKKMLIYWWVGEGFIVPHHEDPNQSTETSAGRDEVNEQVSAAEGVNRWKSIEDIGKQILNILVDKNFIEVVIKKGRESGNYYMDPLVHAFVIERAKEEGFFDFDQKSCVGIINVPHRLWTKNNNNI